MAKLILPVGGGASVQLVAHLWQRWGCCEGPRLALGAMVVTVVVWTGMVGKSGLAVPALGRLFTVSLHTQRKINVSEVSAKHMRVGVEVCERSKQEK